MAKKQAKKSAATAKKAAAKKAPAKPAKGSKPAKHGSKPAGKPHPAAVKKTAKKTAKKTSVAPSKGARKQTATKSRPAKQPTKVAKSAPKPQPRKGASKTSSKAVTKPVPTRPVAKLAKPAAKPVKVAKPAKAAKVEKPAARQAIAPVAGSKSAAPSPTAMPSKAAVDKKRARRPRQRVQSNGAPVAAWLNTGEKPRPSSFIPAPARAEAPSLIAAAPASSDRLIRSEDLADLHVRTVPVRVEIEQGGGRVYIGVNPEQVNLRLDEGIEWDFRYLGGADVTVDEIVIEFDKPSPFAHLSYRSRKPGAARPHRQLSGPAQRFAGKRLQYTIRAISSFRTELAMAQPFVNVVQAESLN